MRYFAEFEYNGRNYHGWQNQPNAVSVQEVMERALRMLLRTPTPLTAAGRTDAGVHARVMVAHFDCSEPIADPNQLCFKLNGLLPEDIAMHWIRSVKDNAHARFDATSRTYEYWLTQRKSAFTDKLIIFIVCHTKAGVFHDTLFDTSFYEFLIFFSILL